MKGLERVPNSTELLTTYNELQAGEALAEERLALYTQWARLDPRLAEILAGYLAGHWQSIAFGRFTNALVQQPWPASALVLLKFAALQCSTGERSQWLAELLELSIKGLQDVLGIGDYSLYFISLQNINRVIIENEVLFSIEPYLSSGYIGSQVLMPHGRCPDSVTLLNPSSRQRILKALLKQQPHCTVNEYVAASHFLVSRRQAQRDLNQMPKLRSHGFTRNRKWVKV